MTWHLVFIQFFPSPVNLFDAFPHLGKARPKIIPRDFNPAPLGLRAARRGQTNLTVISGFRFARQLLLLAEKMIEGIEEVVNAAERVVNVLCDIAEKILHFALDRGRHIGMAQRAGQRPNQSAALVRQPAEKRFETGTGNVERKRLGRARFQVVRLVNHEVFVFGQDASFRSHV